MVAIDKPVKMTFLKPNFSVIFALNRIVNRALKLEIVTSVSTLVWLLFGYAIAIRGIIVVMILAIFVTKDNESMPIFFTNNNPPFF